MQWSNVTDRAHALQAIEEFDALGREPFLEKYGFGTSKYLFVKHNGKRYDIKALAGVTRGYADPEAGPLTNDEFSSGKQLLNLFRRLGFEVESDRDQSTLNDATAFREALQTLLSGYVEAKSTPFGKTAPMWTTIERAATALTALTSEYPHAVVTSSVGQGNWATVPWIAILDDRLTTSTQEGVYLVYLFRGDMTGVYATLNQGVTKLRKEAGWASAKKQLAEVAEALRIRFGDALRPSFTSAEGIDLRASRGLGSTYEASTISWRLYETGALPSAESLADDLAKLLDVYDEYATSAGGAAMTDTPETMAPSASTMVLTRALRSKGFTFASWQVAAFVHALRTKPFVILAGISGTGKSKLPILVGELTGATVHLVPVRPDWTDSADLIGYTNLQGDFVPGRLLHVAREASEQPEVQHILLLDEMNLARVEQYFAEVLSLIEDREWTDAGPQSRAPLSASAPPPWSAVHLPPNLSIVGTVNMDETTHGFSRKVLDRAFTLEMSAVDLSDWRPTTNATALAPWAPSHWQPAALRPSDIADPSNAERTLVETVITALTEANTMLTLAQLQVGYRVRDEVALFLIHAASDPEGFGKVDPLDLALNMKVLPRIQGGSSAVRLLLQRLVLWSHGGANIPDSEQSEHIEMLVNEWRSDGRQESLSGAKYPRTAARLCLMWERLQSDGFTSYWL